MEEDARLEGIVWGALGVLPERYDAPLVVCCGATGTERKFEVGSWLLGTSFREGSYTVRPCVVVVGAVCVRGGACGTTNPAASFGSVRVLGIAGTPFALVEESLPSRRMVPPLAFCVPFERDDFKTGSFSTKASGVCARGIVGALRFTVPA